MAAPLTTTVVDANTLSSTVGRQQHRHSRYSAGAGAEHADNAIVAGGAAHHCTRELRFLLAPYDLPHPAPSGRCQRALYRNPLCQRRNLSLHLEHRLRTASGGTQPHPINRNHLRHSHRKRQLLLRCLGSRFKFFTTISNRNDEPVRRDNPGHTHGIDHQHVVALLRNHRLGLFDPLQASGGTAPYTWSFVSGNLPAGLSLNTSTGIISGTPTSTGTASFTVGVADSANPAQTKSATLSLVVAPATLTITSSALPSGTQSSNYSTALQATGGTGSLTWSIYLRQPSSRTQPRPIHRNHLRKADSKRQLLLRSDGPRCRLTRPDHIRYCNPLGCCGRITSRNWFNDAARRSTEPDLQCHAQRNRRHQPLQLVPYQRHTSQRAQPRRIHRNHLRQTNREQHDEFDLHGH